MPELPEVETIARDLQQKIIGLTITGVDVYDTRVLFGLSKEKFIRRLRGRTITRVYRRGKAVVLDFANETYLVVQVKMTGHLIYGRHLRQTRNLKDTKVVFHLSNNVYLNYNDQRLFGWLIYTDKLDTVGYFKNIGIDPVNDIFKVEWLTDELKKRTAPIKPLLMNQNFLAGIGNIYASEILYRSKIHPQKSSKTLSMDEVRRLHKITTKVLKEAIALRGTSMRNYRDSDGKKGNYMNRIKVYGREGRECFACRTPVKRIVQTGRSTFFCEKCQT